MSRNRRLGRLCAVTGLVMALAVPLGAESVGPQLDQWTCKNAPATNQDFALS